MSTVSLQPQAEVDFENLFAHQIAEMQCFMECMQRDREQIEQLKIETDVLKSEGVRLEEEIQTVIARLKAAL